MIPETGGTGIYCRLSHVRDREDTTKVDDQERICRELAGSRGWNVTQVWKDNNRSAWQSNRKRPGWDDMLRAIRAGTIQRIVVYHGDRLIRHPWDLEVLLDLAESRGIELASPTGTRDLGNRDEHFVLRIEAAMAKRESDSISRRKKAGYERLKIERRLPPPGGIGGRAFGYEKDGRTPLSPEAEAVREAAERVLAGDSLAAICRDLNARGLTATTGKPLTYGTLRRSLLRPRTAGLLADGVTTGDWDPLITPDVRRRILNVLAARAAKSGASPLTTNAHRHLLSGIALCGECGTPVQITTAGVTSARVAGYGCVNPKCYKIRRNAAHLDAYVTGRVLRLLNATDFTEEIRRVQGDSTNAQEIARWEQRKAQSQETIDGLTPDDSEETVKRLLERHRAIERRLAEEKAKGISFRHRTLVDYQGITLEQFQALPLRDRRTIISAAYTIKVNKATRMGPGFNPDDIEMKLRED